MVSHCLEVNPPPTSRPSFRPLTRVSSARAPFVEFGADLSLRSEGKKALFTVGGWSGSVYFSDHISVNTARRTAFAKSIEAFRR